MVAKVFKLEEDLDRYLMYEVEELGLVQHKDYDIESNMDERLKEALKGGAKTAKKTNFGKPDLNITKYNTPVIFENKLKGNRLIKTNAKGEILANDKAIAEYAVNGVIHYARTILDSKQYDSCVAIATAGEDAEHLQRLVYYVYSVNGEPKKIEVNNLNFLSNEVSFKKFIEDATLTSEEKHRILVKSQQDLNKQAKNLNKLMNDMQISVSDRAVYVSGMLLAMQPITEYNHSDKILQPGLTPKSLLGYQGNARDAFKIINQIDDFLQGRNNIPDDKVRLMMSTFRNVISSDADRDVRVEKHKLVAKYISENEASITKQIFVFLYHNIYLSISDAGGALDLMGTLYSEFLKYALSDGSQLGIVLTPSYVTDLMAKIVKVDMDSHVMDLATGSGSFLVSAMNQMISDANKQLGINTLEAKEKIENIKHKQLLGSEINAKLWSLCATNFILRGDGSSQIKKADSFTISNKDFDEFKPNCFLLNPPFSYKENGMPFVEFGLKHMEKGGLAAVIIQDSAGSGKAVITNQSILKHNTLLASIKMPMDLFMPSAGVQTSIYVFRAGIPHDFDLPVKFIDFRNDGYKRTKRGLREIDHPIERYQDIQQIIKAGRNARLKYPELWELKKQVFEAQIDQSGADWNFEAHQIIDTTPREEDFLKVVGDWLDFEISNALKGE